MLLSDTFKLGCDPEWFLLNKETKRVTSAIGKFQGTKDQPWVLSDQCSVQVDNCAVEYGIKPAETLKQWVNHNTEARFRIEDLCDRQYLAVHVVPSVIFPDKELEHPDAWVFGCDPDLNAWTQKWNPKPEAKEPNLRSAGGHIHFGFSAFDPEAMFQIAKAADMFIQLPGLLVDKDDRRRELYGKAGACRLKPYGVEWRTASNFWTTDEGRIEWVWRTVNELIKAVRKGIKVPKEVREIIDTGDRLSACNFCKVHGLEVPE